jgi:hypothetical protein
LNVPTASATNRGALSSGDWTTFNNKQAALNGTGFVKISGTTISYDNNTYYLASNPSAYIALTALTASAPLSYNNTTGAFTIAQASGSVNGFLSSTDWTTFNNKQNTITNPVTGTGTTNYLPKWTSGTAIGNSLVFDDGTNVGIGTTSPSVKLDVVTTVQASRLSTAAGQTHIEFVDTTNSKSGYLNFNNNNLIYYGNGPIERLRLDASGNLGLGVVPSAWTTSVSTKAIEVGSLGNGIYGVGTSDIRITSNAYFDGAYKYAGTGLAGVYQNTDGTHRWFTAPSGTAGNAITFTQAMTLTSGGNLLVGTTTDTGDRINSAGSIRVPSATFFRYDGDTGLIGSGSSISGGTVSQLGIRAASDILFATNGANERLRITSGGNLLVNTTSDAGYKLDVNGTGRFSGQLTASTTVGGTSAIFQNTGAQNSNGIELRGGTVGTSVNWKIEKDNTVGNAFQITPSTTNGGTTYTTPSLTIASTGAATFSSTITTAAPTGGTAKPFKIGAAASVSPTSPNRTIEIEIDGTTYYLSAKTTND